MKRSGAVFFPLVAILALFTWGGGTRAQSPAAIQGNQAQPANPANTTHPPPKSVNITLLDTTDVHGHIEPLDYYANKPIDQGLAKIATLVNQERAKSPAALLLDCGDTIQGTPLAYYFAVKDTRKINPTIAAFNAMHYDAMAVGNHEFNFGRAAMWKAKRESNFPWLAANVKQIYTAGEAYFRPYIIKNVGGVRIAIVGFVTPGIPRWEIPDHYKGYEFQSIVEAAKTVIPEVRKQADLVVVIMHSGLGRDPQLGAPENEETVPNENVAWDLAEQVPGIDVIFYGHTHLEMPQKFVNGVLLSQPKNWGGSLARADVVMSRDAAGAWKVESKRSKSIPATAEVAPDPKMLKLIAPYNLTTQKYLDTPIATSEKAMNGRYARYGDEPLVDLIHKVQLDAAHADVSMATMFYTGVKIPLGQVTVRQAAALYVYDNTLYAVEMTGAQLKDALEHAASFFSGWPLAEGQSVSLPGYNADSAEGVSYVMDLSQPVGRRIQNLTYQGKPLADDQKLKVAINNYRYTGGGGYKVYQGLPLVYQSPVEIRDLLIEYLTRVKKIPATGDDNWKIVPPEALAAIKKTADGDSRDRSR